MTIKKTYTRKFPAAACLFSASVALADPVVDEDEDEEEEGDSESAEGDEEDDEDSESAEGDEDEDEDSESAEGDEGEDEDESDEPAKAADGRQFVVVANSGKPMRNVPWWGTLGIELSGIRAKDRVPALMDHDVSQRVGVFEKRQITEEGLVMSGAFLKNSELASRVNTELRDGFPYEASVRLHPLKVEEIAAGETAQVNGHDVNGPAFIFRESELRETSLVTLGQDPHTAAAALAEESPQLQATFLGSATDDKPMAKKTTNDPQQIAADAVAAERNRIATLTQKALPEQKDLLATMLADGTSVADGIAKLHADLSTRFEARRDEMVRDSDASLSGGNSGNTKLSAIDKIRAMPDSKAKHLKLYELDAKLQEDFTSAEAYAAWAMEPVNQ